MGEVERLNDRRSGAGASGTGATDSSRSVRLQLLQDELEKAWQENEAATHAFNAIAKEAPSGLPEPDGSLRIRQASARMNEAIRRHMRALERYAEFARGHQTDRPDDLDPA
jgi:hypothetical protein